MKFMTVGELIAEPLRTGLSRAGSPTSTHAGLTLSSVRNGRLDLTATKPIDLTVGEELKFQVRPGAFYVVRGNGRLSLVGRGALAPDVISTQVAFPDLLIEVVPDPSLIDPQYLALVWNEGVVRSDIESRARTSSGIHKINLANLRSVRLPVPTLAHQRAIASALIEQLAAVDVAGKATELGRVRVDDLRVRLFRELLRPPLLGPWPWVRLDAVAEFLDGRRRPISASERASRIRGVAPDDLVPYYGANGRAGWIDKHLFDEPLVLLAEDGGAFGSTRMPIAYRIDGKAWVNNHAHVLRPLRVVDVDFLGYALSIRPEVGDMISGSTRGKLNQSVAAAIRVPLPPLDVQGRIAAELRERLATIHVIEASIQAEREAIEALPAALLRRAFVDLAA